MNFARQAIVLALLACGSCRGGVSEDEAKSKSPYFSWRRVVHEEPAQYILCEGNGWPKALDTAAKLLAENGIKSGVMCMAGECSLTVKNSDRFVARKLVAGIPDISNYLTAPE